MNIHEYQGKQILAKYGVSILKGFYASSVSEAVEAAKKLDTSVYVVKAQIHAGGRGKGGGVKIAKSIDEVKKYSEAILGMNLITHQTGPEGRVVKRLYIEAGCNIHKEYYLSCIVDRSTSSIVFVGSTEGGVEIEEVAEKHPEKVVKVAINPSSGYSPFYARKLGFEMGLNSAQVKELSKVVESVYNSFVETDASQIEINPLVETADGKFIALDAKFGFDSNALYKHPEIVALRDENEEDKFEIEASKYELSYVKMDGNIGCMVNGAGLAMATMDIIKLYGKAPANFLDVGGGANKEKVTAAFKIILSDPSVKGVLVNIFGGIMKCDIIAEGVVSAAKEIGITVPLVVRLEGTNVELGKKILSQSGLKIVPANDLEDAAKKITDLVA